MLCPWRCPSSNTVVSTGFLSRVIAIDLTRAAWLCDAVALPDGMCFLFESVLLFGMAQTFWELLTARPANSACATA